jgi:hypothetical protein
MSVNYAITAVWALAFVAGLVADLAMAFAPAVPTWLDAAVIVAALIGAARFTQWYPDRVRKAYLASSRAI